jgi:D-3-phosphoglycerate dehydrogenase / 2-oxoglutarate reductase
MFSAVRLNHATYPVEPQEHEELRAAGAALTAIDGSRAEEIIERAGHCDALLVVSSRITAPVIDKLPQCRVIARLGAGTDNVDIEAATHSGIVVTNVPDFCLHEQAEHAMALLLAWARRLPEMFMAMQSGEWSARHHPGVHRLAGRTLGLIGFGRSAQAVAQRARGFELNLLAWTRRPDSYADAAEKLGVQLVDLESLLAQSDYVSVHLPLTDGTRHLLDAGRLRQMKSTAVLINTSRGAIVDEQALVDVLRAQRIAGAGLDVFEGIDVFRPPCPPPLHPLYELDNVLMTPHCAGSSIESTRDSKIRGTRNAAVVLQGRWPPFVVNPQVQPRFPLQPPAACG